MAASESHFFQSVIIVLFSAGIVAIGAHDLKFEYGSLRGLLSLGSGAAERERRASTEAVHAANEVKGSLISQMFGLFSGGGTNRGEKSAPGTLEGEDGLLSAPVSHAGSEAPMLSVQPEKASKKGQSSAKQKAALEQDRLTSKDREELGNLINSVTE